MWGHSIKLSLFGESHGKKIGITIEGLPAGIKLDWEQIHQEMNRRKPGKSQIATARIEDDAVEIISGYFNEHTTGSPLTALISNNDTRQHDYDLTKNLMRPSHADFTIYMKYDGFNDYRGGGYSSGRITAPLVFAGAIAKQILEEKGIFVGAHIKKIGSVTDAPFDEENLSATTFKTVASLPLPVINEGIIPQIEDVIMSVKNDGNSIGGLVECGIIGLPVGIGEPFFDSIESTLSHLLFSIPAIKGVEFGAGFEFVNLTGDVANDSFYYEDDVIKTKTNYNGGVLGGISTGMPVVLTCVIKPTPSIAKPQATVDIKKEKNDIIRITGRHDPCIVPRIVPVVEAVSAIGILDLVMRG